jgi:hypothetical protein
LPLGQSDSNVEGSAVISAQNLLFLNGHRFLAVVYFALIIATTASR